jgi:iron complex transport system substrate-binding protein
MRRVLPPIFALILLTAACGATDEPPGAGPSALAIAATASSPPAAPASSSQAPGAVVADTTPPANGEPATTAAPVPAFPVSTAGVEITKRPERIVSLSSTTTEILFAIGAGDQVVAVDSFSDYPAEAPITELNAFEPNVEAISTYEPDLVIFFLEPGALGSGLTALGIPVIHHVAALGLDDVYAQITDLGAATGNVSGASQLIEGLRTSIADVAGRFGSVAEPLTYYHEVDDTYYSATSATFIGSIYSLFGLTSIADAADDIGSGFPQLSPEYIIEADPDIIFYGCAEWCGTTPESIAERPGWGSLSAVESGALVAIDDDLTSRWGPRLAQFVETVGMSLETLFVE